MEYGLFVYLFPSQGNDLPSPIVFNDLVSYYMAMAYSINPFPHVHTLYNNILL